MFLAFHGRAFGSEPENAIKTLINWLIDKNVSLVFYQPFANWLISRSLLPEGIPTYQSEADVGAVDAMISIGGDGTLLETLLFNGARQIPMLAINTGRLGFLADINLDGIIDSFKHLLNQEYRLESRTLVSLDCGDNTLFNGKQYGLNEFTISKLDTSSMVKVKASLNGQVLNNYWADGLIVSTPTGSTGYSLSSGGPLLMPDTQSFIVCPICPHNLAVRPIVVSDTSTLEFEIEGRSNNFLISLDSRSETVDSSVKIIIKKEKFFARLIKLPDTSFIATLQNKLNWGYDLRN